MTIKVYYLDDEVGLCHIFSEYCVNRGIEVMTFTDASRAISYCKVVPPDMMFIDYRLTDTTGDEVASKLADTIKKVLVTGELDIPDVKHFISIISKPYKLSVLKEAIESEFGPI